MTNRDPHMNTAATAPTIAEQTLVSVERLKELMLWLDRKYDRHGEEEDDEASDALAQFISLRTALRDAKPALEAGANCIEAFMLRNNDV
jgi:hypothetical protein